MHLAWLFGPIDGQTANHHLSTVHAWHGRAMVLAWTLLLPMGIVVARYFKVTRWQIWPLRLDNKRWWHLHLTLQIAGVVCMSLGVAIVWINTGSAAVGHSLHASLGWLVVLLSWAQLVGGYLRGTKGGPVSVSDDEREVLRIESGDHYHMTPRRVVFEWLHKLGGYGALVLSVVVTALGLDLAHAPVWMWLTIALWWSVLLCSATIKMIKRVNQDGKFLIGQFSGLLLRI